MISDELENKIFEAVREISCRHREIINDWCKAYMAQLYEEGVILEPGCYILNEQEITSKDRIGRRYWFEKMPKGFKEFHSLIDLVDVLCEIKHGIEEKILNLENGNEINRAILHITKSAEELDKAAQEIKKTIHFGPGPGSD